MPADVLDRPAAPTAETLQQEVAGTDQCRPALTSALLVIAGVLDGHPAPALRQRALGPSSQHPARLPFQV